MCSVNQTKLRVNSPLLNICIDLTDISLLIVSERLVKKYYYIIGFPRVIGLVIRSNKTNLMPYKSVHNTSGGSETCHKQ